MDAKTAQSFDTKVESGGVLTTVAIASLLATVWVAVFSMIMALIVGRNNKSVDKLILFWLFWDIFIHFGLEGPFVYLSVYGTIKDSQQWIALPWKEYGKADKRWLVSDPTVVSLELLTVGFVAPLCVVLIYAICAKRHYRHWLQLVVCTCELYGGWMTFCPEWLTGSQNLVTSNWLFLWVYLVFFNMLWVVVPVLMMWQSWNALSRLPPERDVNYSSSSSGSKSSERITTVTRRTVTETVGDKKKTTEVESKMEQFPADKSPSGRGRSSNRKAKKLE